MVSFFGSLSRSSGNKHSSQDHLSSKPTHFPATPFLHNGRATPNITFEPSNEGVLESTVSADRAAARPPTSSSFNPQGRTSQDQHRATKYKSVHSHRHHKPHKTSSHRRRDSEISLDRVVIEIIAEHRRAPIKGHREHHHRYREPRYRIPISSIGSSTSLTPSDFGRPQQSRHSSFADLSTPESPTMLSNDSLPIQASRFQTQEVPARRPTSKGRTFPNPPDRVQEDQELLDELKGLRNDNAGLSAGALGKDRFSRSATSVASMKKADKILGTNMDAKLASLYLVSGLGKATAQWSMADLDTSRGVQPLEDSLGLFWRPELLGSAFSGDRTGTDQPTTAIRDRKDSKASTFTQSGLSKNLQGKYVSDAGPDGAQKLVAKTLKFAHPRDVEVVNSTLSPPTTCHAFTFTIPRHDTLAADGRSRLDSAISLGGGLPNNYSTLSANEAGLLRHPGIGGPNGLTKPTTSKTNTITFYGVTLTVWTHADRDRSIQLKGIKTRYERAKLAQDSLHSMGRKASTTPRGGAGGREKRRTSLGFLMGRNRSESDFETETGMSDSDLEGGPMRRSGKGDRLSTVDSVTEDVAMAFDESSDIFWMPYAITMVSRFPIYDILQDYLRLSWARFSKNARLHMSQVTRLLNFDAPRPGDMFHLLVGSTPDDQIVIEGCMPGGLMDFERGLMKVDFQLWPLFQAVDLDHILTCAEVALSNSGRIIFCSKHPAMLNIAVSTLKYIVELRGWNGIALPIIHSRDATFIIEDPGPYIIGMPSECRYLLAPPSEVVIVDIDTNSLTCKSPPVGVITPRTRREKARQKLIAALGPDYPSDRSIPMEFKVSYPKGNFRNFNRLNYKGERPSYLGERVRAPVWWKHETVLSVFDKILADKHKKPTLIQRFTKTGMARAQAQLTVGEQLAKTMMRKRALHYVETRDDLELKVSKINRRLLKLIQEGEHWKQQFETFEKYADRLTVEANELKSKIEKERREAKRLSSLASERSKQNVELEEKLRNTETARAEAMRQLSDMHQSIQELEREREEIMNTIESQINGALATLPSPSNASDTSSRPTTPSAAGFDDSGTGKRASSILATPRSRLSYQSSMSKLTTGDMVSVLGQVRGDTASQHIEKADDRQSVDKVERRGGDKRDSMMLRVANIQAKLGLALHVVASQRSESSMTSHYRPQSEDGAGNSSDDDDARTLDLNENENEGQFIKDDKSKQTVAEGNDGAVPMMGSHDEEEETMSIKTPIASRRPSNADLLNKDTAPPLPDIVKPTGGSTTAETIQSIERPAETVGNSSVDQNRSEINAGRGGKTKTVGVEHGRDKRSSKLTIDVGKAV
nr:uncharacterized protein CI109_006347 [Kwoniella shandongensis]KAA5525276.1 hypothetical protein CI109_006347 [Kwoniella shandongensis]